MSDPNQRTQANPHPASGHRTPREIAKDEAGPIGQADEDVQKVPAQVEQREPAGSGGPLAPGSRRPGERG